MVNIFKSCYILSLADDNEAAFHNNLVYHRLFENSHTVKVFKLVSANFITLNLNEQGKHLF